MPFGKRKKYKGDGVRKEVVVRSKTGTLKKHKVVNLSGTKTKTKFKKSGKVVTKVKVKGQKKTKPSQYQTPKRKKR